MLPCFAPPVITSFYASVFFNPSLFVFYSSSYLLLFHFVIHLLFLTPVALLIPFAFCHLLNLFHSHPSIPFPALHFSSLPPADGVQSYGYWLRESLRDRTADTNETETALERDVRPAGKRAQEKKRKKYIYTDTHLYSQ